MLWFLERRLQIIELGVKCVKKLVPLLLAEPRTLSCRALGELLPEVAKLVDEFAHNRSGCGKGPE